MSGPVPVLGVIVGLRSEARAIAARLPPQSLLRIGGAQSARTEAAVGALLEGGATHLVSFGLAGALQPGVRPGRLIVPTRIIDQDGLDVETDSVWRASLALPTDTIAGSLLGTDKAIATAGAKAAAYAATAAVAVDMESHILARAAAGRPLLVIRAIADPAERDLPRSALRPLHADGTPDIRGLLQDVTRRPAELPALIRLGLDARAALEMLRRVAGLVGGSRLP